MKLYVIYAANTTLNTSGYLSDETDWRPDSFSIKLHPTHFWEVDSLDDIVKETASGEIVAFFSRAAANAVCKFLLYGAKARAGSNFHNIVIEARPVIATPKQVQFYYNKPYRFVHEKP